jgi:hypothetical protein
VRADDVSHDVKKCGRHKPSPGNLAEVTDEFLVLGLAEEKVEKQSRDSRLQQEEKQILGATLFLGSHSDSLRRKVGTDEAEYWWCALTVTTLTRTKTIYILFLAKSKANFPGATIVRLRQRS